jgi:hypothetical protein
MSTAPVYTMTLRILISETIQSHQRMRGLLIVPGSSRGLRQRSLRHFQAINISGDGGAWIWSTAVWRRIYAACSEVQAALSFARPLNTIAAAVR